jgi:hypothetical protein
MSSTEGRWKGVIFTPADEPYLGRELLFHFDQMISAAMEQSGRISPVTRQGSLSDLQKAATQLIPQGISLALSIRELIRQGYLFGAAVMLRPLMERAAILSYLHKNPAAVALWKEGWKYRERPSLSVMIDTVSDSTVDLLSAKQMCENLNHLVHGDPVGSDYNLAQLGEVRSGYAPSKMLSNPELCDYVCSFAVCWIVVLLGMMCACFPEARVSSEGAST